MDDEFAPFIRPNQYVNYAEAPNTVAKAAELTKAVTSVSVPSAYDLSLWYGSQYRVELGDSGDMDYKLEYLKEVVSKLEDYRTGTIDLTFSEGSEARFTANES